MQIKKSVRAESFYSSYWHNRNFNIRAIFFLLLILQTPVLSVTAGDDFILPENNALHSFCHADGKYHLMGCILSEAMLAMAGAGEYKDVQAASKAIVKKTTVAVPDKNLVDLYEIRYKKFRKLYPLLKEWSVADFQAKRRQIYIMGTNF